MRRLLFLLPTSLLLAACGGGYGGGGNSSAGSGSGSVVQTIQISEKEYSLTPATVSLPKAGTYAFRVTNNGTITHAFTIEPSGGGTKVEGGNIQPGSHKTVKYTFVAGKSYEMFCPIDGHRAQGMSGTIKVGGGMSGATTTAPAGTTTSGHGY
jgi:plastocyanin